MCSIIKNQISAEFLKELVYRHEIDTENEELKNSSTPTDKVPGIILQNEKFILSYLNWGIQFSQDSPSIYNSRLETIKSKNFWWDLLYQNRAVIPMSGFYEWNKVGKRKNLYRVFLPEKEIFYVAAIYYVMNRIKYSSLITTIPNKFVKRVHPRMLIIFDDFSEARKFLTVEAQEAAEMCLPYSDDKKMGLERVFF
jgi:putative SOS response-associated peptidase YedK